MLWGCPLLWGATWGTQAVCSLIVRPHSQDANNTFFGENLIHHAMLNVDAARTGPGQVSDQLLKRWRLLKRIGGKNREQFLRLGLESAGGQLFCIFERLPGKDNFPSHHSSAFALVANGSAMPALIDSRMPGTASRYKVS